MMKKRIIALLLAGSMVGSIFAGCGKPRGNASEDASGLPQETTETEGDILDGAESEGSADKEIDKSKLEVDDSVELQVFIAASLNTVMKEIVRMYNEKHPDIRIVLNADSSGKLLTQIEEGYSCDVFFSAAEKQMDTLEADGLVEEGTRKDVVNNQVVVIKRIDTESEVHGLDTLKEAESIALADGSVPVGRYTRQALVTAGILPETEEPSAYTTAEISELLGGVEISEQGNASQVLTAVEEGSCEVGTVYYSDLFGHEDSLEILETISNDLTGDVIYPVCQVVNDEAAAAQKAAAAEFVSFICSEPAKALFSAYNFDINVE